MRLEHDTWHPILKDMIGGLGRLVRPMVQEVGQAYQDGWTDGWEWLDRGPNFLVTNRPGGPWRDGSEISSQINRAWREGWADGILSYMAANPEHPANAVYPHPNPQKMEI